MRVNSSPCRHVDTLGPWDSYLIGRSRECAEGFPRKRAKLAAGGVVAFELLIPDPSTTELLLDEFITVEASSWKSATGSALSQNPHMEAFFRELLLRFSARGQARFFFLRCGRRAVAAQFSLHYASRIWELKTGSMPTGAPPRRVGCCCSKCCEIHFPAGRGRTSFWVRVTASKQTGAPARGDCRPWFSTRTHSAAWSLSQVISVTHLREIRNEFSPAFAVAAPPNSSDARGSSRFLAPPRIDVI